MSSESHTTCAYCQHTYEVIYGITECPSCKKSVDRVPAPPPLPKAMPTPPPLPKDESVSQVPKFNMKAFLLRCHETFATFCAVIHNHATIVVNDCRTMNKNELVVKYREPVVYYGAIIISIWLVATIGSSVVRSVLTPTITANVYAYEYVVRANACGRYADKIKLAELAYNTADDGDICSLAAYISRNARNSLDAGVQTSEEERSFGGFVKGCITGWINPGMAVNSLGTLVDSLFGNWEEVGNRLDARYQPIYRRYNRAQTVGSMMFWLILVGAIYCYYRYRRHVEAWLRPWIKHLPFIGTTAPTSQSM